MPGSPSFELPAAAALAWRLFGVHGAPTALPGESDQNVLLTDPTGDRFVLKISHADEHPDQLDAEAAALAHLAPLGVCPQRVPTLDGSDRAQVDGHWVRLLTALDGQPLATAPYHSRDLQHDVGRTLGRLTSALTTFDHPAAHREHRWDLANAQNVVAAHASRIADGELRAQVQSCADRYDAHVAPRLATLRRGVVHGDGNDYNVLVDPVEQVVTGVIDFGDMVYSHTVNDLAITAAYVALSADDPLAAAAAVTAGFHESLPLTELELAVLWPLLCMRLAVSVCLAAVQQHDRPDVPYLGISQNPIRNTLPRLLQVHPRFAHYALREACGFPPVPDAPRVQQWLREHAPTFAPLLGVDLRTEPLAPLDFSAGSTLIANDPEQNAPTPLDRRVRRVLADHGASVGVGGYDEARLIYRWPNAPVEGEPRTVHMGLDLSLEAGASLFAPLDGVVHGFENATGYHDYGPLIVLRHETTHAEPITFYSFYGHLSLDSLDGLQLGQRIARGAEFARIGSAPSNGHWWEHVHVQLITDMLDVPCNVDGAVRASQRGVWKSVFLDPNLLLGIPETRFATHRRTRELTSARAEHTGGNLRVSYADAPLTIVRGHAQYLFDENGHRFVDAYNNVPHVGHSHPRVVRAVSEQLALLNTNTRYVHEQLVEYAEALTALLPAPLTTCYFTASGSEANELALRLARAFTGARNLVVMEAAYHGHTCTMIDISPYKHAGPGGAGAPDWVHTSPVPDVYRAPAITGAPGAWFAAQVGDVIERIVAGGDALCGYIAESCPSVAGQIMLPDGFLADVYARVRAHGGVCIADEVQTGFGRLGSHFWAFEAHDVVPDIVVLGKPIANGYPMAAVITTRAIADAFDNGMEFFSTFGGSTAACVAAMATLRVTQEEQLPQNATRVGTRILDGLRALATVDERLGDVRGAGLFIGAEMVTDGASRTPDARAASFISRRMRDRGVLVGTDGVHHNVIKIRGPLVLTLHDADRIVDAFALALRELPPQVTAART